MSDFRSRVLGTIIGILSRGSFPKWEPVAFLYGHVATEGETPTHTINGVDYVGAVLPDIFKVYTPELQAKYPYAFIREHTIFGNDAAILVCLSEVTYVEHGGDTQNIVINADNCLYFENIDENYENVVDHWVSWPELRDSTSSIAFQDWAIWSNFTMYNLDGSVCVEASNPVPVYEQEVYKMGFEEAAAFAARKVMGTLTGDSQPKFIKKNTPTLEYTDMAFTNGDSGNIRPVDFSLPIFKVGGHIIVEWDGKDYLCEVTLNESGSGLRIGNSARNDGNGDTGEPFFIASVTKFNNMKAICLEERENGTASSTHSFAFYEIETIHPIDPKYLPGVCLPVVELETQVTFNTSDPISLSESDAAKLEEVYNSGAMCFAVSFLIAGGSLTLSAILTKQLIYDQSGFFGLSFTASQIGVIMLFKMDGGWFITAPTIENFM